MVSLLNALSGIAILVIVASGLALILGLMEVINLMHPGLMAIGAYGALEASRNGIGPWPALVVGTVVAGAVGFLMERLVVRRLYQRPLDTILATWGMALATWQILTLIFTRGAFPYGGPARGLVEVAGFQYSAYRLILVGIAVLLVAALAAISRFTKIGLVARAVMANEDLARGLGLNTYAVRLWTFTIGAALAGAAGVLIAPLFPITAFIGLNYLIPAFLVVLLAGRTVWGLVLGDIVMGGGQSAVAVFVNPILALAAMLIVAVLILRFVPNGFDALRRTA